MKTQTTITIILVVLAGLAVLFYVLGQAEEPADDGENEQNENSLDEQNEEPSDEDTDPEESSSENNNEEPPAETDPENNSDQEDAPPESVTISFNGSTYTPSSVTIAQGATVTWVNESNRQMWPASNVHPTHEIYSEFDPQQPIAAGESWSFTFEEAGTWQFHDHLQPSITGTVTVGE